MTEAFLEGYMTKVALRTIGPPEPEQNPPAQTRLQSVSAPVPTPSPTPAGATPDRAARYQQAVAAGADTPEKRRAWAQANRRPVPETPQATPQPGVLGWAFNTLVPESERAGLRQYGVQQAMSDPDRNILPGLKQVDWANVSGNKNSTETMKYLVNTAAPAILAANPAVGKELFATMAKRPDFVKSLANSDTLKSLWENPQVKQWAGMLAIPVGAMALLLFWKMMKSRRQPQQQQTAAQQPYAWRIS